MPTRDRVVFHRGRSGSRAWTFAVGVVVGALVLTTIQDLAPGRLTLNPSQAVITGSPQPSTTTSTTPSMNPSSGTSTNASSSPSPAVPSNLSETPIWIDNFDGPQGSPASSANWTYQLGAGGWGNNELQTYTTSNGVLDGQSHLVISAVINPAAAPGQRYTSARLFSNGSFTTGRLTARIKIPDGTGLLPAFWLLGSDIVNVGYPACGEIDVVETPFGTTRSTQSLHGPDPDDPLTTQKASTDSVHSPALSAGFHDYWVDRSPGRIAIGIDDETTAVFTKSGTPQMSWVFDKPFQALFSLAIGGNWPGSPDTTRPSTAEMVIDWIRLDAN